tara:strand:- start:4736 stop:5362 length:627 start_codon:yes stop_codon:yes gene_type:complete
MRSQSQWIKDSIANTRLASEVCAGMEIRSLDHNKVSSNDTHHFNAHIYVDGIKVMRVENDGRGDNNYYTPSKEEGRKLYHKAIDIAENYCKTERWYEYEEIRSKEDSDFSFYKEMDLEFAYLDIAVGSLINEQLTMKEMGKALRKNIHIIDRDANSGKGLLYATDKRATDAHIKNSKKAIETIGKHFDYILINNLNPTTQLKLWLTIN